VLWRSRPVRAEARWAAESTAMQCDECCRGVHLVAADQDGAAGPKLKCAPGGRLVLTIATVSLGHGLMK
jgi:hypothetical protein